ncbi:MAG: hypothetical protein QG653_638 [Patescibacteria group bacterium]|nr:hypothetical protein [Patescibacteria group bacterium]
MKTYVAILIGIVVLFAVVFIGYKFTSGDENNIESNQEMQIRTANVSGSVTRAFEGDHTLAYSFGIPEVSSSTVDMDGGLVHVIGANGREVSVYFSYEGARGYSPVDYISDVVAVQVPVIDVTGTTTLGGYEWTTAETAGSEWYLAETADKQWLIVVEAKKTSHDVAVALVSSMSAE